MEDAWLGKSRVDGSGTDSHGAKAMTVGKKLMERGVIALAREVARDGRPARQAQAR